MNRDAMKSAVDNWIDAHREDLVKDICKLVAIKSVKSEAEDGMPFGKGCAKAIEAAVEMFKKDGFACANLENYIAYADINDKKSALDILGHLDVVGEGDGWTTDPYTATVKDDGCIYGRGTSDDKGPVLAAYYAMRAIKESGIELSRGARLIVGGDEESGSELDVNRYYRDFDPAPATFSPDASFPIFNTEKGSYKPKFEKSWAPTTYMPRVSELDGGFRINVIPAVASATLIGIDARTVKNKMQNKAQKLGVCLEVAEENDMVTVKVTGKGAHASLPEESNNGICALLELLCELPLVDCGTTRAIHDMNRLFPSGDGKGKAIGIGQSDDISGDLTVALTLLKINEKGMWGMFDSRIPVCATEDNCKKVCEKVFADMGYSCEGEMGAPHHTPADSDFVRILGKAYEEYTGKKAQCLYMGGGTYVHYIDGGVAFGAEMPGFDSRMHGADERANIDDLICSAKIFSKVILDMCL